MDQRTVIALVIVFVFVVAGMFGYAYYKRGQLASNEPAPQVSGETETAAERINAKHFFEDGAHTVAGEVSMPTPCDLLNSDVQILEEGADGDPSQVNIELTVVNTSETCAQVITPARFKESFEAPEDVTIEMTLRGEPVILNLVEAGPGESPDDFELFIKG